MRHKEKFKSAYRIVSDPFAQEEEWVAAALTLPMVSKAEAKATRASVLQRAKMVSNFRTVLALLIMTVSSVLLVRAGYDWGYKLVDVMFGQQRAFNQGIIANFSIAHLVFPVCLGILVAGRTRAKHSTRILWILLGSVLGAALWDSLIDNDLFFRVGEIFLSAFSGVVAYFLTRWNRARMRVSSLNLPELWNLQILGTLVASSTVLAFTLTERLFPIELLAYASTIALVSYFSRASIRSKRPEFENALLVLSPVFVCNGLNLLFNLVSLLFDSMGFGGDLGWRALLSAFLINCVAYLALYVGLRAPKSMPERAAGSRLVLR